MNTITSKNGEVEIALPKQLLVVGLACFAQCSDGTIRKVHLAPGQPRKLHNYVKHNLSGGKLRISAESCLIVPAVPKKSLVDKVRDSLGLARRAQSNGSV